MTIVVTGGIGSGKTSVCSILSERYGFPVYEADVKVKMLYDIVPGLVEAVERVAGRSLRDSNGHFVPSLLAEVIFDDAVKLNEIEQIVFPALKKDFSSWLDLHSDCRHHIFESATILEKQQFDDFGDIVLLVDAPVSLRLDRAASRDGSDRDRIVSRMKNQTLMNRLSEGDSDQRVNHVIWNVGSYSELVSKVDDFVIDYRLT